MHYEIVDNSSIRGGADMNISDVGDVYLISGRLSAEVGKRVFGRWVGIGSQSKDFSIRVPKQKMSEAFVSEAHSFTFDGIEFTRSGGSEFRFSANGASGSFQYSLDGNDPVDISSVEVSALGMNVRLSRV